MKITERPDPHYEPDMDALQREHNAACEDERRARQKAESDTWAAAPIRLPASTD